MFARVHERNGEGLARMLRSEATYGGGDSEVADGLKLTG
jgi:hypothetical protein